MLTLKFTCENVEFLCTVHSRTYLWTKLKRITLENHKIKHVCITLQLSHTYYVENDVNQSKNDAINAFIEKNEECKPRI